MGGGGGGDSLEFVLFLFCREWLGWVPGGEIDVPDFLSDLEGRGTI
jgi:hypothetical protein